MAGTRFSAPALTAICVFSACDDGSFRGASDRVKSPPGAGRTPAPEELPPFNPNTPGADHLPVLSQRYVTGATAPISSNWAPLSHTNKALDFASLPVVEIVADGTAQILMMGNINWDGCATGSSDFFQYKFRLSISKDGGTTSETKEFGPYKSPNGGQDFWLSHDVSLKTGDKLRISGDWLTIADSRPLTCITNQTVQGMMDVVFKDFAASRPPVILSSDYYAISDQFRYFESPARLEKVGPVATTQHTYEATNPATPWEDITLDNPFPKIIAAGAARIRANLVGTVTASSGSVGHANYQLGLGYSTDGGQTWQVATNPGNAVILNPFPMQSSLLLDIADATEVLVKPRIRYQQMPLTSPTHVTHYTFEGKLEVKVFPKAP